MTPYKAQPTEDKPDPDHQKHAPEDDSSEEGDLTKENIDKEAFKKRDDSKA